MSNSSKPTVLGRGIKVRGDITGAAPIEIWGSLEGTAGTEGVVTVRPGGKVNGQIAATDVMVEGRVEGKIHARRKLELRDKCEVKGDISAAKVAIDEGSFFEGKVEMGKK